MRSTVSSYEPTGAITPPLRSGLCLIKSGPCLMKSGPCLMKSGLCLMKRTYFLWSVWVILGDIFGEKSTPSIRPDGIRYQMRYPACSLTALLRAPYGRGSASWPSSASTTVSPPICSTSYRHSPSWARVCSLRPTSAKAESKAKTGRPRYKVADVINPGHHFGR